MKKAIDETMRRRNKQIEFNKENNIEPKGIIKPVKDIIDGIYQTKKTSKGKSKDKEELLYTDDDIANMDSKTISKSIQMLEKQMHAYAKNLEFEKAANCRDKLEQLKKAFLYS
jgi:excinuclease ABC subunit B